MKQLISFLEYMVVIYIILDNISPYSGAINRNYYVAEIAAILIVILLLTKCLMHQVQYRILRRWAGFCIPYYILTISYFFVGVSMSIAFTYVAKFLIMLPVLVLLFYIYCSEGQGDRLLLVFVNIMTVIACLSLFFWVFASQLKIIHPTGSIDAVWGVAHQYPSYFGVYFEQQRINFFGYSGIRNQGIFYEAPMFSCCLVLALAMQLFIKPLHQENGKGIVLVAHGKRWKLGGNAWKSIVLEITIVTTVSTLGILLMLIILFFRYLMTHSRSKTGILLKSMFAIFLLVGAAYLAYTLVIEKMTTISGIDRIEDFQVGFRAWKKVPIFGVGYNNYNDIFRLGNGIYKNGFSNSIMAVLAQGGIALSSIYIASLLGGMIFAVKRKQYDILAFNMIVWLEFAFTAIPYTFLLIFHLAYFYSIIAIDGSGTRNSVQPPLMKVSESI